jgi:hypothetical protein
MSLPVVVSSGPLAMPSSSLSPQLAVPTVSPWSTLLPR